MRFHLVTIGTPKLEYARLGWEDYFSRLKHYHKLQVTHIPDRKNDVTNILAAAGNSYKVGLIIEGRQLSSPQLAEFLTQRALEAREVSFLIGGPDGLPKEVIEQCDFKWSFGRLTYPHDLAMVILLEALYRASTLGAGRPYHR